MISSVNNKFSLKQAGKFVLTFAIICSFLGVKAGHPEGNSDHEHDKTATESVENHADGAHENHGEEHAEEYNAKETIMHHISDAHEWEFFALGTFHATIPLPVILYSKENGLDFFFSSAFKHKDGEHSHSAPKYYNNYILHHEKVYLADANGELNLDEEHHATNAMPMDFSITKNVASMMLSVLLLCLMFITVANAYTKKGRWVPKGIQAFMEPLILFVRNDVVQPNMGKNTDRFLPYMLTLFFFIWMNNMLGLLPGAANVTGNIAITAFLALVTLIATLIFAKKYYWGHIFNPPGVPKWLFPIMIPVEIVGIFTKPFALMIRLFANVTAGHIIILSILGLIFMFSDGGQSVGTGFGVSIASTILSLFLYCIELLVAFLQAFIFTLLTSLFIGQALEEHDHAEAH